MLNRFGGFKSNAKIPPLLIPAIPCSQKTNELCNGWFIPCQKGQKACLHCLGGGRQSTFPPKTKRQDIITDITITWHDDKNWSIVYKIISENEEEYKRYKGYFQS